MACYEKQCRVSNKNCNNLQKSFVECEAPFCNLKFHVYCTGINVKNEESLKSLYFVCNRCINFFKYVNSPVEDKINRLNNDLNEIDSKISLLNNKVEKKICEIDERLNKLEGNYRNYSIEVDDKINKLRKYELEMPFKVLNESQNKLEKELNARLSNLEKEFETSNKIKTQMDCLEKNLKEVESKIQNSNKICNAPPPPRPPPRPTQDNDYKLNLRISGIPEIQEFENSFARKEKEHEAIKEVFRYVGVEGVTVKNFYRIGTYNSTAREPRRILVSLTSCWDVRKIIAAAPLLKNNPNKVFINPDLSPENREKEKRMLKKRRELIIAGNDRKDLKIKNMVLYCKNEVVPIE